MARFRSGQNDLTGRQREIISLVAKGHTNIEIGERLGISAAGVRWHVSELLMKFNVESREELAEAWTRQSSVGRRFQAIGGGIAQAFTTKLAGMAVATTALVGATALLIVVAGGASEGTPVPTTSDVATATPSATVASDPTVVVQQRPPNVSDAHIAMTDATRRCTEAGGVTVSPAGFDHGTYSFTISAGSWESLQDQKLVYQACYETYYPLYFQRTPPPGRNPGQSIFSPSEFATCLRNSGVDVMSAGTDTGALFVAARDAGLLPIARDCATAQMTDRERPPSPSERGN